MKIDWVKVSNFRPIAESGEVELHPNVTTLVGPNEAGKTSFIEALHLFGTDRQFTEDDLCDYDEAPDAENSPLVKMKVSQINPSTFSGPGSNSPDIFNIDKSIEIKLSKSFNGTYHVESGDIEAEISRYESTREDRIEAVRQQLRSLVDDIQDRIEEIDPVEEDLSELASLVNRDPRLVHGRSARQYTELKQIVSEAKDIMMEYESDIGNHRELRHRLMDVNRRMEEIRPAADMFVDKIFSSKIQQEPELIGNSISLESLEEESGTPYHDLLSFVGLSANDIRVMDTRERRRIVDNKMEDFSNEFQKNWDQGNIRFDLDLTNDEVTLLVSDNSEKEQYIEQRSRGFRYFLTFFVELIANDDGNDVQNQLLLLDDPGLHLHPDRQKDLRDALKRLGEDNQVLYTSHSPYMIDRSNLNGVRVVNSKDGNSGTNIESNFSLTDEPYEDALKPLRGALGATFADSLFASKRTILVEGYTDRIFLNRLSKFFRREEKVSLPYDVALLDMGGGSKWEKYTRFLSSEDFQYCLVKDYDGEDQDDSKKISESQYLAEDQVVRLSEIVQREISKEETIEIENLFSPDFYEQMVSMTYENINKSDLNLKKGKDAQKIPKQVVDRFNELNGREDRDLPDFDKSDVAERFDLALRERELTIDDIDDTTIGYFDELINKIQDILTGVNRDSEGLANKHSGKKPKSSQKTQE